MVLKDGRADCGCLWRQQLVAVSGDSSWRLVDYSGTEACGLQLYMRTVMMALKASPTLTDFVMGILQRLISKQVHLFLLLPLLLSVCVRITYYNK